MLSFGHHFFCAIANDSSEWPINAFTTGNPFFFTNLLEVSTGRDFGALKGVKPYARQFSSAIFPSEVPIEWSQKKRKSPS